jgi:hypothetical protein
MRTKLKVAQRLTVILSVAKDLGFCVAQDGAVQKVNWTPLPGRPQAPLYWSGDGAGGRWKILYNNIILSYNIIYY